MIPRLSVFTALLASSLFLVTGLLSAHAQRYVTNLTATQTMPGALGVGTVTFDKRDFLQGVGQVQQPPVAADALDLVFDVGAKQFLVVRRTDGATITVVYALSNDQNLNFGSGDIIGDRSAILRRADLLEVGGTTSVGSIAGVVRTGLDQPNALPAFRDYYRWEADFQILSQTGGAFVRYKDIIGAGQHAPMVLRGVIKVRNKPFVPTSVAD